MLLVGVGHVAERTMIGAAEPSYLDDVKTCQAANG